MKRYTTEEIISMLKPCPFCGRKPTYDACDILITISCKKCGYSRSFNGLLSHKKSPVEVPVRQEDGTIKEHDTGLYYHRTAHELALIGWNKRKGEKND